MSNFNILCIRFSSMGDVVLQTTIIEALKSRYGDKIHITFLVSDIFEDLLKNHPSIDSLKTFSRKKEGLLGLKRLVNEINNERKIDLILDLHDTLRSKFIRLFFPFIPRMVLRKRTFERELLASTKINLLDKVPQAKRNLLDFQNVFEFSPQELQKNTKLPEVNSELKIDGKYIVICPTASFHEKRWPIEYFYQLLELLLTNEKFDEYKFVILAGKEDSFCSSLNSLEEKYKERFFNFQGKTTLKESISITSKASFCISNDTGIYHIAEAYGINSLVLFGPTSEHFGFSPILEKSKVLSLDLPCRPCSTKGNKKCKQEKQLCFLDLKPDYVFQQIQQMKDDKCFY